MDDQEDEDKDSYAARCVDTIHEKHGRSAYDCANGRSPPIEVMKGGSEIRRRADLEQKASQICNQERHEISHGDERCYLVDIGEHSELRDDVSDNDGICGLIALLCSLSKDR